MSRGKKSKIPWWLIILLLFVVPPVGVILLVLKLARLLLSSLSNGAMNSNQPNKNPYSSTMRASNPQMSQKISNQSSSPQTGQYQAQQPRTVPQQTPKVSMVAAIFFKILGIFNAVLAGIGVLAFWADPSGFDASDWSLWLFFAIIAGGSLTWSHILKKRKHDEAIYYSVIGNHGCVPLEKLVNVTQHPISKVERDLQRLITAGKFGNVAYIDTVHHLFMRSPDIEIPQDYRTQQQSPQPQPQPQTQPQPQPVTENTDTLSAEYMEILDKIQKLDDDIADEPVSAKIQQIKATTAKIFTYVTEHPEKKTQINTFMNYYLPTTMKLLTSYSDIERAGTAGENITEMRTKIETILDSVVTAFNIELDKLYSTENIDISGDIAVLEQKMKLDGLTEKSDFDFL